MTGSKPEMVRAFLAGLDAEQAALVLEIRTAVRRAAPVASEAVKQGWLFFERFGPIGFIQPHRRHVNLVFWRGAHLPDPARRLEGAGRHMRHLKVASPEDVDRRAIAGLVRAAVRLNVEKPYQAPAGRSPAGVKRRRSRTPRASR